MLLLEPLLGLLLQVVEGILAIARFVPTCLRHAAHPLQLGAVQVVGPCHLAAKVVLALLTLLQIVSIVAMIGIHSLVIEFQDYGAHIVEEVSVVRHHEQREVCSP